MTFIVSKKDDPIEYLVNRKFPNAKAVADWTPFGGGMSYQDHDQLEKEIEAYRIELMDMPTQELNALHTAEQEKDREEWAAIAKKEEEQLFFNRPNAKADFGHWSKTAYWTLAEAIALSFGKDPAHVSWEKIKNLVNFSPFVKEYQKRRDLVLRAKNSGQLSDETYPGMFLAWAERLEIPVPPELVAEVKARGIAVADWKTAHDQLKAQYDADITALRELAQAKDQAFQALKQKHEDMQEELAGARQGLELQAAKAKAEDKPLQTKERETLLKLAVGMAVAGYSYDPSAAKSDKIKEICGNLDGLGISLTDDTVRAKLKEGAALIPQDALENMETKPKSGLPKPKSANSR